MRGLVIDKGVLGLRDDLPEPLSAPEETRVRVLQTGVCATDLALRRGYMGFQGIPGHEFVGVALEGPLKGHRVVGDINAACGTCEHCLESDGHHCRRRSVLGILGRPGAFAETLSLPTVNLLPVPHEVSNDAAVFTEPLAAAFEIAEQVDLRPGMTGLVAGDGRLGLLCAHVLHLSGVRVTLAGRHAERSSLVPEGITHVTGLLESDPGERFDVAVEATGHPDAFARMLGHVRPRGTLVLKTTSEKPAHVDLAPLVVDEITVVGSRCGPFGPALEALAAGAVDPTPLIEGRYSLGDGIAAFDHASRGGVLKILVEVSE